MSRIPPPGICTLGMQTERKLSEFPAIPCKLLSVGRAKPGKPLAYRKVACGYDRFGLYSHDSHYSQDIANAAIPTRG
jgi:hypothetical protein